MVFIHQDIPDLITDEVPVDVVWSVLRCLAITDFRKLGIDDLAARADRIVARPAVAHLVAAQVTAHRRPVAHALFILPFAGRAVRTVIPAAGLIVFAGTSPFHANAVAAGLLDAFLRRFRSGNRGIFAAACLILPLAGRTVGLVIPAAGLVVFTGTSPLHTDSVVAGLPDAFLRRLRSGNRGVFAAACLIFALAGWAGRLVIPAAVLVVLCRTSPLHTDGVVAGLLNAFLRRLRPGNIGITALAGLISAVAGFAFRFIILRAGTLVEARKTDIILVVNIVIGDIIRASVKGFLIGAPELVRSGTAQKIYLRGSIKGKE
jgi:hypothetical protein